MEPETISQSTAPVDPAPPTTPASFTPKKPPKLLFLLGGVAIILVSIALAISFFGKNNPSTSTSGNSSKTTSSTDTSSWAKYSNGKLFYEFSLPPKWSEIKHSPLQADVALFNADNLATLEITSLKSQASLEDYLASQDEAFKTALKSTKSSQVKVGQYDGYERMESWSAMGLQGIATYIKIQDILFIFTLSPAGGTSAITSDALIRDYKAALTSFRLTETSQLGVDLKEYTSQKVEGLAFKSFSLKYPQTWALSEKKGEAGLEVSIYRNNYELTISQKAIGGAVCLFSDSPAFEGSSGDLRSKQYAEFNTTAGATLRRYFNANAGDKSTMFFCEKQTDGPYFQTPLAIGGLVYNVPAKYDADIIKEMDEIVKSINPVQ